MDAGTVAAIVALVIAFMALVIACAQAAQQYAATAYLMRKCDSIVFGPLPGTGHRVWVPRQLRFKVVYSIPQISLRPELWPSRAPFTPSYSEATEQLPRLATPKTQYNCAGEASWTSFCRTTQRSCYHAVRYQLVAGDADRCPADFPVVPMQVSWRDVLVMSLMSGMKIMSTDENGLKALRGRAGTITGSQHPILGHVIHFTPANAGSDCGLTDSGDISPTWMARLWGDCPVAQATFNDRERMHIEKTEFMWLRHPELDEEEEAAADNPDRTDNPTKRRARRSAGGSIDVVKPVDKRSKRRPSKATDEFLGENGTKTPLPRRGELLPLRRGIHDGEWEFSTSMSLYGASAASPGAGNSVLPDGEPNHGQRLSSRAQVLRGQSASSSFSPSMTVGGGLQPVEETLASEEGIPEGGGVAKPITDRPPDSLEDVQGQEIPSKAAQSATQVALLGPSGPKKKRNGRGSGRVNDSRLLILTKPRPATSTDETKQEIPPVKQSDPATSKPNDDLPPEQVVPDSQQDTDKEVNPDETGPQMKNGDDKDKQRLYLLDAINRKWVYPFEACKTWAGMTELIKDGFAKVDFLEPQVAAGRYNLYTPDNQIINPRFWEDIIEPGWTVEMRMLDRPQPPPPPGPPPPGPSSPVDIPEPSDSGVVVLEENRSRSTDDNDGIDGISWFWISQMNNIPGYWATPWLSRPSYSDFWVDECLNILIVMLQALLQFTDTRSLRYVHDYKPSNREWINANKATFPPYARNARNGVVVGRIYEAVAFHPPNPTSTSKPELLFQHRLPPIELLRSYDDQVNRYPGTSDAAVMDRQLELTALDSWLSLAGRTPEISDGASNLLRATPPLAQKLITRFADRFNELDRTASEGGLQEIQRVTDEFLEALVEQDMSEAERLFFVVAVIRTAKVALCVMLGPSTAGIQDELRDDLPVYLV